MFIRVNFHDNDFGNEVRQACESIMYEIANGYEGDEAIARYNEIKARHGIENIRKSIVLSSYGYYIAKQGHRWGMLFGADYDVDKHKSTLEYLDKEVVVQEVKRINEGCPNSEVCYIDFYQMEVYLV